MHVMIPATVAGRGGPDPGGFLRQKPAFIVDSRKSEFPWDRRPLELWPTLQMVA